MASWASRELVQRLHAGTGPTARRCEVRVRCAAGRRPRGGARHRDAHGRPRARPRSRCARARTRRYRTWLIAWVGDCRVYRVRAAIDEPAELLTRDDTYRHLGEKPPPGGSPDDPARMVGNGAVAAPNVDRVRLRDGEMLVLCSDGLHKHVEPREIHRLLRAPMSLADRCLRLLELARMRGSNDDATVLVVQRKAAPRSRLAWIASGSGLLALLSFALAASLGYVVPWNPSPPATLAQPAGDSTRCLRRACRSRPATGACSTMTPDQIDRVFGRGRLKMVTGEHVEVFREAVAPGERRRYTKRFLNTTGGDFAHWTEREWRILARLIGHGIGCVPDVVQFDRGSVAGTQLVQTYDAGVTVDQWATLLPLLRDGHVYRHAFEDCAHWWALAHHCLVALNAIHQLQLVHLDIKGDNVCIPLGPASFDPDAPGLRLHPIFGQLALIDFAFALVSRETPHHATADRLAKGIRLSVAAPAQGARRGPQRRSAPDRGTGLALRHVQSRRDAQAVLAGRRHGARARARDRMDPRALRRCQGADPDASRSPRPRRAATASACAVDRSHWRTTARGRPRAVAGFRLDARARRQRRTGGRIAAHADDAPCPLDPRVRIPSRPGVDAHVGRDRSA